MEDTLKLLLLNSILCGCILWGCKTTEKCDAYSIRGYDHIQVVGYTDTVPTYGEESLHLPPGEYTIKAWAEGELTTLRVKL